jgi:hypothetical protein
LFDEMGYLLHIFGVLFDVLLHFIGRYF